MTTGVQKVCTATGPLFVLALFAGMIMAGLFPPTSPSWTAQHVAQFWGTHTDLKRAGILVLMSGAALQVPFGALLTVRLKRIEGRSTPFAYMMLMSTGLSVMAILLPVFFFAAASYRPQRSPEITQALNDLGWLPFVMNWPPATAMALVLGFAVLGDRRESPLWPRWSGYYNLWVAFLFTAGGFAIFFTHGVFAWNGLLAYWMAAVVFGSWFFVLAYLLWTTIDATEGTDSAEEVSAGVEVAVP